jgi:hypothetical protein
MSETIPTPQRPTELPPHLRPPPKRFPRARRWLFNFAAALSLVLFVGNYWMWVRGASGIEDTLHSRGKLWNRRNYIWIQSYGGKVTFVKWNFPQVEMMVGEPLVVDENNGQQLQRTFYLELRGGWSSKEPNAKEKYPRGDEYEEVSVHPNALEWFGMGRIHFTNHGFVQSVGFIDFPYWFLQLLFAILPLWWLGRVAVRWSEKRERMKAEG